MPVKQSALARAYEANRELQNRIHQIEQPLKIRIRELEVEVERLRRTAQLDADALRRTRAGLDSALGLLTWVIASESENR